MDIICIGRLSHLCLLKILLLFVFILLIWILIWKFLIAQYFEFLSSFFLLYRHFSLAEWCVLIKSIWRYFTRWVDKIFLGLNSRHSYLRFLWLLLILILSISINASCTLMTTLIFLHLILVSPFFLYIFK